MLKVIVKVLLVLALLVYGAFFLGWNMQAVEVTGFRAMGQKYSQQLPIGSLVFVGLIIGALFMAVAAWSAWAAQKAAADKGQRMVARAKEKLQAQLETINELRGEVKDLKNQVVSLRAGNGTWGKSDYADGKVEVGEEAPKAQAGAKPEDDDDEVI